VELWTAFLIGLAGSLHCIGMCGPIAVALPTGDLSRLILLSGRLLYNIGRSITYGIMGVVAGLIGQAAHVGGYQQMLSISLGVLLLLAIILPSRFGALLTGSQLHARLTARLGRIWTKLTASASQSSLFTIGILNGFLPCGLVYVALAGAVSTGHPVAGGLYMVTFGLGTLPVMLAVSLAGRLLGSKIRRRMRQLLPVGGVILATLFILRGLSLGIPYVSPRIQTDESGNTKVVCPHHLEKTSTDKSLPSDSGGP